MLLLLPPACCPAVPRGGAFLVNRAFQFELLPESSMYMSLCGGPGATLLDGELLLHSPQELQGELAGGTVGRILQAAEADSAQGSAMAPAQAMFLMFDAVAVQGACVGPLPFDKRLDALGQVRLAYKKLEHKLKQEQSGVEPPLILMSKRFWPSRDVEQVFRHIKVLTLAPGLHRKVYTEGARCNLNDGAVFTPVHASYTSLMTTGQGGLPLLKWKSAEDSTVDFSVQCESIQAALRGGGAQATLPLSLSIGGGAAPVKVSELQCTANAARGMLAAAAAAGLEACVLECSLTRAGWQVVRLRPGKARGNHVFVGWHTLQILAMPVSQRALCAALARPAGAAAAAPAAAPAAGAASATSAAGT